MKHLFLTAAVLMTLGFVSGCTPRYVDVRGELFEMISEREEARLVEHARVALKTISKKIPPADMKFIDTNEPEKRFIYSDHRYGRAIIRWHFTEYEVGVDYEGELMTDHMSSTIYTRRKKAETVDFTNRPVKRRSGVSRKRNK